MSYHTLIKETAIDVVRSLLQNNRTVATAESCTGGMVASALVDVPGCSEILHESYVTYSDEAKHRILGVSSDTLRTCSAVSEQCALEMAEGVRRISGADYGVSTTGYAGPGGGTESDPVGTVYIAIAGRKITFVYCIHCDGDRATVRATACMKALTALRNAICE